VERDEEREQKGLYIDVRVERAKIMLKSIVMRRTSEAFTLDQAKRLIGWNGSAVVAATAKASCCNKSMKKQMLLLSVSQHSRLH
jgi:hypothetical protein